ncbi:LysR family transcriptional regulator [Pseudonocardia kunmingensis]|uniref:LysR family hydrogen peroxide-inducible transcriptional activator n=1 Tax=Pseudonocardia kunmingensis TaxID=630975 RepID=A0A543DQK1_9PSEU|nr:LysR family transcriptional regulator [Pseudonocardia kunmingensis]TQM11607.1 LysR family hydrogen peroxide-inducible transcriptional activator [Pseudonocardia kunmingensis]
MDLVDLQAFLAVVEHNGFRRAAEALFVSQPVVTRRIGRLEQELGVALLERGAWGVRLTGHGEALVDGARRVLDMADEVRAATVGASPASIRLGCSATAAGSYLAAFLSDWIPRHPSTRVTMIEDGAHRMRRRLEAAECDAAIIAAPVPPTFESLPITTVTVQAVLPARHRLAAGSGPLDVAELDRELVLVNGRSFLSTELFLSACRVQAVEPDVVYECSVGQTLAALAEAGLGVAIISDTVDRRGFDLTTRPICDAEGHPLQFDLHVAWARNRSSEVVAAFARELSDFTRPMRTRPART